MTREPTGISGAYVVRSERRGDSRGWFMRGYAEEIFAGWGLNTHWPHVNASGNARAGTVRGLHWQAHPHGEIKLVRCVRGACFDVAVDLRPLSPSFKQWHGVELTAENGAAYYIPAGCAHGFQTLAPETELLYLMGTVYEPDAGRGLRWDDADLAIAWPDPGSAILSDRDAALPTLRASLDAIVAEGAPC